MKNLQIFTIRLHIFLSLQKASQLKHLTTDGAVKLSVNEDQVNNCKACNCVHSQS